MIDMAPLVALHLQDDTDVAAAATVYADEAPESPAYPLALVRSVEVTEPAPPMSMYERHELQIDVVALEGSIGALIAAVSEVRRSVLEFTGLQGSITVAGCDVLSMSRINDTSISPARPRWVLAVEVTARLI